MSDTSAKNSSLLSLDPSGHLADEFNHQRQLFNAQPPIVQQFFEAQARQIARAYIERSFSVRFGLPDRIVCSPDANVNPAPVSQAARDQRVGTLNDRLARRDVHITLRQHLTELEQSSDQAVAVSAGLIRYVTASHMIHNILPSGRRVTYAASDEEDIPTIPVGDDMEPESAITADTDAIAEEGKAENGRGNLLVPFVPEARRFYLPQWVAFGENNRLLVNSVKEAEAHVASMQNFLTVLFAARSLAPYILADEEYQNKHYGMMGQLINQGRSLARYMTSEIVRAIKERAAAQSLNRGLSLRLPYFDDQELRVDNLNFVVIPAGRIMFVPAFVVRASLEEQAKITQDTRFNASTRKHLLVELKMLEDAFESPSN